MSRYFALLVWTVRLVLAGLLLKKARKCGIRYEMKVNCTLAICSSGFERPSRNDVCGVTLSLYPHWAS